VTFKLRKTSLALEIQAVGHNELGFRFDQGDFSANWRFFDHPKGAKRVNLKFAMALLLG
jgi:hypothetical protein